MAAIHVSSRGYFAIVACILLVQNTERICDVSKLSVALKMMEDSACDWTIHESYLAALIGASRNSENIRGKASNKTVPHTCADIKRDDSEARDGEYWLFPTAPQFHGGRAKIYCLISTTHQLEYLTLPNKNFGVYPKYGNTYCSEEILLPKEVIHETGDTYFFKIRINPSNMSAVDDDFTFSRSSRFTPMKYGDAGDCYSEGVWSCGPNGTFHINTLGTGMKFNPNVIWNKYGYLPHDPQMNISRNGSVIDLKCGGSCGGCGPESPLTLYPDSW